jgi:hypothetical protein
MKIWYGHGSEHSANLVMIGHFRTAGDAAKAKEVIDTLTEQVAADSAAGLMEIGIGMDHFTDKMLGLLQEVRVHDVGPAEMEQFGYDFGIRLDDTKVVLTTEESDVSAFLKVLIDKGARVEAYSAHDYPDAPYGRGK